MQKELQTYVDELFTDISPTAKSEAVKNELLAYAEQVRSIC